LEPDEGADPEDEGEPELDEGDPDDEDGEFEPDDPGNLKEGTLEPEAGPK